MSKYVIPDSNRESRKKNYVDFQNLDSRFHGNDASVLRWKIFSLALAIRAIIAFVYYGSCDINAFVTITQHTLANDLPGLPYWNYFPAIALYLWFAGYLVIFTQLPLAFCLKIIPVIIDSLLAVLIFDIVRQSTLKSAFARGMLYALCPVPIIITCIHGQWDALFLFFMLLSFYIRSFYQDNTTTFLLFGLLFGYAILIKPVVLMFAPLFFVSRAGFAKACGMCWQIGKILITCIALGTLIVFSLIKHYNLRLHDVFTFAKPLIFIGGCLALILIILGVLMMVKSSQQGDFMHYVRLQLSAVIGCAGMIVSALIIFYHLNFDLLKLFDDILRYCNQGVQLFGLPFAWPFSIYPVNIFFKNRIWIVALLSIVAWAYYKQYLNIFHALAIDMAIIIGFSGLCPQYLMWLLPFLLITSNLRWAGVYGLFATIFLMLFYSNPYANLEVLFQNSMSFAPLKICWWLAPPAWSASAKLLTIIHILGSYLIPATCLTFLVFSIKKIFNKPLVLEAAKKCATNALLNWYVQVNLALVAIIVIMIYLYKNLLFDYLFEQVVSAKQQWYVFVMYETRRGCVYNGHPLANVIVIGLLLTSAWFLYVWKIAKVDDNGS